MGPDILSLENRVALVTGGGTGIGLGIARVLDSRGARLALAQNQPFEEAALGGWTSGEPLRVQIDISDPAAVEKLMDEVDRRYQRIDIVVNNAALTGLPAVAPFLGCSPEQLDRIVDVNLKGTYYVSQHAARLMVRRKIAGSIIHIASVGAFAAQQYASAYCATKAALVSLAQGMALELAEHGIRVNAVAPGDILTPASANIVADLNRAGASPQYVRATPLGRRGRSEDIGRAVAFLASGESSFVTGATLLVDGGFLAY
ncbi:MAG TPA: SDR family oxidoreductase [Bryobacteraceae bacterium]|nr:SDR family oxidoreductase [Bryobacteraceae bacterium]